MKDDETQRGRGRSLFVQMHKKWFLGRDTAVECKNAFLAVWEIKILKLILILFSMIDCLWQKELQSWLSLLSLRLHQTEEKSKVHGCINSYKFLVAEGYIVKVLRAVHAGSTHGPSSGRIWSIGMKYWHCWFIFNQLGGFELAKTETSLKKSTKKSTKDKEFESLCYYSPEVLKNINHPYSKDCEMYRSEMNHDFIWCLKWSSGS